MNSSVGSRDTELLDNPYLACSAGVFFERAICSRKRHVETSRREEEMERVLSPIFHCHKIKDGGYNNITNTNKVSPAQNTPALQANPYQYGHLLIKDTSVAPKDTKLHTLLTFIYSI